MEVNLLEYIDLYFRKANNKIAEISTEMADKLEATNCRCDISEYIDKIMDINSSMFILDKTWADYNTEFGYKPAMNARSLTIAEKNIISLIDHYTIRYNMNDVSLIVYPLYSYSLNGVPCVRRDLNVYTKEESDYRFYPRYSNPEGFITNADIDGLGEDKFVRFDINTQGLNALEKQNARTNISAVSIDTQETISGKKTFSVSPTSNTQSQSVFDLVRRDELKVNYRQNITLSTIPPLSISGDPATKLIVVTVTAPGGVGQINRISSSENSTMRVYSASGITRIVNGASNLNDFYGFDIFQNIDIAEGTFKDFILVNGRWRTKELVDLTGFATETWVNTNFYDKTTSDGRFYPLNLNPAGYLTQETDPTVPSWVKSIIESQISNWDESFSWGNHSLAGYALSSQLHNPVTLGTPNGLSLNNQALSLGLASSTTTGALSNTDWNTFNNKYNQPTGTASQYIRGDGSLATLNTTAVPEGTNLYFTNARARQAVSLTTSGNSGASTYNNSTGVFNIPNYTLAGLGGQPISEKGQANGYTPLDANGKVPLSHINDSILGQVKYIGTWNATTNTPTLPDPTTVKGDYYVVTSPGTQFGKDFNTGDWVISDGVIWDKVDNTDAVATVFGRVGNILAIESDYQSFYPRLSQIYTNPSWIGSLAWSKITGTPTTLSGYGITDAVPSSRTITINGVTHDLSLNRSWSVGTVTSISTNNGITGGNITSTGTIGLTGQALALHNLPTNGFIVRTGSGTVSSRTISQGAGISISNSDGVSGDPVISSTITQYTDALSRAAISLTTSGSSGASTYSSSTGVLNVPNYTLAGLGGVPVTRTVSASTGLTGGGSLSGDISLAFDTAWGDGRYVTISTAQTITGLKTIQRSGEALNFGNGTDSLYQLKIVYSQNEVEPNGEATWSFENKFNRNSSGFTLTPLSFFRGILVTGQRLITSSISTNLINYYINNPAGTYPISAYHTRVHQYANGIIVGDTTGRVNESTGAIADLPSGVIANFKGRVKGSAAVDSNDFVTLSQIGSGIVSWGSITGTLSDQTDLQNALNAKANVSHVHSAADITSGTLPVGRGGTGATTFTSGNVLIGAGTGAVTTLSRSGIDTRTSFPAAAHTHPISEVVGLQTALDSKENSFTKNTAFNKNFGTTSGTVAQGNDSRILNGQTAFGWGDFRVFGLGTLSMPKVTSLAQSDAFGETRFYTSESFSNVPFSQAGTGIHLAYSSVRASQLWFNNNDTVQYRTASGSNVWGAVRTFWTTGNLPNPIQGTGTAGQVSFWTGAGVQSGDSGLFWDNINKRLGVNTSTPLTLLEIAHGSINSLPNVSYIGQIIRRNNATSNAFVAGLALTAFENRGYFILGGGDGMIFQSYDGTNPTTRWSMLSNGILQSNGAQTIQTSTGNLTIATGGGNGNILLSPNGTGAVLVGTTSPLTGGGRLQVNGAVNASQFYSEVITVSFTGPSQTIDVKTFANGTNAFTIVSAIKSNTGAHVAGSVFARWNGVSQNVNAQGFQSGTGLSFSVSGSTLRISNAAGDSAGDVRVTITYLNIN